MKNIEQALGTVRGDNESWEQVFKRINTERGIDTKTIYKVLVAIIERLDLDYPDLNENPKPFSWETKVDGVKQEAESVKKISKPNKTTKITKKSR